MRRRLTIVVVGAICLAAIPFALTAPREPVADGHPISYWLDYSKNTTHTEREAAIRKLGVAAVPWLVQQVKLKDTLPRTWLAAIARKQSWIRINIPIPEVQHLYAVEGFRILGPTAAPAVEELIRYLRDPSPEVRRTCAGALGVIRVEPERVIPALLPLLRDTDDGVRGEAVFSLGYFGKEAEAAVESLLLLMDDPDSYVQGAVAWALGRIGCRGEIVVPRLLDCIDRGDNEARADRIRSLGNFPRQADAIVPALIELAGQGELQLAMAALESLGDLKRQPEIVVPYLIRRVEDPHPEVRYHSVESLGKFGHLATAAVPHLNARRNDQGYISAGCVGRYTVQDAANTAIALIKADVIANKDASNPNH